MNITGKTRVTGLFGYPVEHTLSPAMHNAAFDHLGLNFRYLPFLVQPDSLRDAIGAVRALNLAGVNITVPHKEKVIPFLDEVDGEASFIGAVNTIVNSDGTLTGYNTDGRGFMRSLAEENISVEGKRILIAGAGGASRAVSYYLSQKALELRLFDPERPKLEKLVSDLAAIRTNVRAVDGGADPADFDILVNATPLGLRNCDAPPFDAASLTPRHVVCDLIYKKTNLIERASERGCRTIDGIGMLLWQGILAFELWTNVSPPVEIMRKALLQAIPSGLA
jgi:shikimate dehydrogenase